ncbi:hypothetical protein BH10CYA1_BH10CYA1_05730 [soil metagenome]
MSLSSILNLGLEIAGVSMIALAIGHVYIARLLNWKEDLKKLTPINEQVFYAHTLFIACGLLLLGLVITFVPSVLVVNSMLAMIADGCFALCWFCRLIFQFVCFTGKIHDNKKVDTALRLLSTILWLYYTVLFTALFAYQCGALND